MDAYTRKTMEWLNERYRSVDESGVYFAHQPIYGFHAGHSEVGILSRYALTYQILKALAHLRMESLLDVGCSEGFKAHQVAEFFSIPVHGCDLSEEAFRRAREIFKISTDVVDIHGMPYADGEFDVVLCSETLEHVTDFERALSELLRVARRAVLITVPHEPKELIEHNRLIGEPHAHIHSLDEHSFDFLRDQGHQVFVGKIFRSVMKFGACLVDAHPVRYVSKRSRWLINLYNASIPIPNFLFGKRAAACVMRLDEYLARCFPSYDAMVVTVLKDGNIFSRDEKPRISARQVLAFQTPLHYLKK